MSEDIILKYESFAIQGAVFEVYREMGSGFLEAVYHECLEKKFTRQNIPFISQSPIVIAYKGETLLQKYVSDFICYGEIIVELKAVKEIAPEHKAQMLNYLKVTSNRLGLIVNFAAHPKARIVRMVM